MVLGKNSLFYGLDSTLFRGVFNEREETIAAHTGETQLYTIANSIYNSDFFISIPKLKTHHKTGVTLNLKGLVGTVTQKNQLVHWRIGYPEIGGDEYPDKQTYERMQTEKIQERGAWIGNDTIWRMVVDLYTAIKTKKRAYFTIVDGIIGGEGKGPFCPSSVQSKTLIASNNFLAADIVATRFMGIDYSKITCLNYLLQKEMKLEQIKVTQNGITLTDYFDKKNTYCDFKVTEAWKDCKI